MIDSRPNGPQPRSRAFGADRDRTRPDVFGSSRETAVGLQSGRGSVTVEKLTRACLEHPRIALGLLALLTVVLATGLPKVRAEYGYEILLGHDHPAVVDLQRHVATFGGGVPLKVAWECGAGWPCAHPLDPASLAMAHAVSHEMERLIEVQRVHSPSNASLVVPDAAGFAIRRLVEHGAVLPDAAELSLRAARDPLWRGVLLSDDETVGVLLVQPRDTGVETGEIVLDALLAALEPWQEAGFEFSVVGNNVAAILGGRALDESIARVIPALVVVIGLVLVAALRSWRSSALVLISMGVALAWTFGALGHLDWPQDGILEVLAPLVLVVGVCDAIHFVNRARHLGQRLPSPRQALLEASADVGPACAATTATTAVAFLSFAASDLATFVRFGVIASVGVVACLLVTFTLLPILAEALWKRELIARGQSARWEQLLGRTAGFAQRQAVPILSIAIGLLALGLTGATRLVVDTDWEEMMGRHHPAIQWIAFQSERVGRSETLEIGIELPDAASLPDPATLAAVTSLAQRVAEVEGFDDPTSLVDALERLNRALHSDDPAFSRLAPTRAGNAELIEILAFEDPGLLPTWLSVDRRALRISLGAGMRSQHLERRAVSEAERIADDAKLEGWNVTLTGEPVTTSDFVRDVSSTQLRSFPAALILVWLVASIHLRSLHLGAAAVIPTVLPAVLVIGMMGWLTMPLDIGRAMVAAVVIGVGVDDAIHLLTAYQRECADGASASDAMLSALEQTGPALATTSLALALGFLSLRLAAWATIASFGLLVAVSIAGALASTILVLPALLTRTTPQRSSDLVSPKANENGRLQT